MNKGKYLSVVSLIVYLASIFFLSPIVGDIIVLFSIIPLALMTWYLSPGFVIGVLVLLCVVIFYGFDAEVNIKSPGIIYILFSGGMVLAFYLIRKRMQYLSHYQARQEAMLENSTDIVAIMNSDGVITYTSSNIKVHFGWVPTDIINQEVWMTVHPDDLIRAKAKFNSLLEHTSERITLDFRFRCADGAYRYVDLSAVNMLQDPIINGILVNYRDVDQQKQTERALLANEYNYRILFENMQDTVCMLDNQGCITDINEAGINLMGYARQEIIGMTVAQLVHPDDQERSRRYFEELDHKGCYSRYEGRVVAKSGKPIWIQVDSNEFIIDGVKIGSQDIVRDISVQKEVEQQMRQQNKMLQELNATKDKFFSIISHDLRSPFNSILGLTKLLDARFDIWDDAKKKNYIKRLKNEAGMTYKLLDNLLDWARIQTRSVCYHPQKYLLQELVKDEINLLEELAANKNIKVNRLACQEELFIHADKNMITTVFRNLFSNAVKFTPENGCINISCQKLFLQDQKRYVQVAIKDSGVGIPTEQLQKLFQLEELVSTKGTAGEIGTGLGLILCKEFIDKHGGRLDIKSQEGLSSTFTVSLELI